ncbi:MAG TPA: undecaprenyldiphospho-muramoylpentapeptide beta-N-acetylglucosaminyltransferase [Candidatus Krumholzibacteria bacterium]|nr:undecaprenyldiphospho-muramoylpentapeptide beta-N-acetylglucosaminyltransferase [Candidatus Krumholzibacteria bacterium]
MRIVITGGGTGGHVYPGLAVAEALRGVDPEGEVLFVGTRGGMEARLVPEAGYPFTTVPASGVRGLGWGARLRFAANLAVGLVRAWWLLWRFKPDMVLATGGYVSVPVVAAARLLGRRIVLQEQNSVPGSANRLAARWAEMVYLGFAEGAEAFPGTMSRWTGNPVRRAVVESLTASRREPWNGRRPLHLLIFGGSRGARTLNRAVMEAAAAWTGETRLEARIQTGPDDHAEVDRALAATRTAWRRDGRELRVTPFIEDMAASLAWADLVVCRAGAMTLSELTAAGLPAILVPFPHATDDHQTRNAAGLSRAGAAELLPDDLCTGDSLRAMVDHLRADPEVLADMARRSAAHARPDAAMEIAVDLLRRTGALDANPRS